LRGALALILSTTSKTSLKKVRLNFTVQNFKKAVTGTCDDMILMRMPAPATNRPYKIEANKGVSQNRGEEVNLGMKGRYVSSSAELSEAKSPTQRVICLFLRFDPVSVTGATPQSTTRISAPTS
jgi:hypothetical protein